MQMIQIYVYCAIFVVVGISCGCVTQWVVARYISSLPYTVAVFLTGSLIALLTVTQQSSNPFTDDSYFDSNLILYIFQPILVFREVMNLNWHHVVSGVSQSSCIAGIGAVISCFLMALFSRPIFSWSWPVCFMFGAILSSTDPVAIISLLDSSGAAHQLRLLLVGESLLNDGSAMILFLIFFKVATTKVSAANMIEFIMQAAFGSIFCGIVVGFVTQKVMRILDHPTKKTDMMLQILVTIFAAYFSFLLGEYGLGGSGVLCTSATAAMLAWLAPPVILRHKTMHDGWVCLEWVCNTLIFFMGGLIAGNHCWLYVQSSDYYFVLLSYILMQLSRAVMMAVLYPVIRGGRLSCTVRDAVFMSWAGLRGGLAIVLALIVEQSKILPKHAAGRFFVIVAGIVACTLVINAMLARSVLQYLGLAEKLKSMTAEKQVVMNRIKQLLKAESELAVVAIRKDSCLGLDDSSIKQFCSILKEEQADEKSQDSTSKIKKLTALMPLNLSTIAPLATEHLAYIRSVYLATVRIQYEEYISHGKIGRACWAAQCLLNSLDVAMEQVQSSEFGLKDWECLREAMTMNVYLEVVANAIDVLFLRLGIHLSLYDWILSKREMREIYMVTSFIEAHEHAQRKIIELLSQRNDAACDDKNIVSSASNTSDEIVTQVKCESEQEVLNARRRLQSLNTEDIQRFCSHRVAREVLLRQRELVHKMVEEGTLSVQDAAPFMSSIATDIWKIDCDREALNKSFIRSRRQRYLQERTNASMAQFAPFKLEPQVMELSSLNPIGKHSSLTRSDSISAQ